MPMFKKEVIYTHLTPLLQSAFSFTQQIYCKATSTFMFFHISLLHGTGCCSGMYPPLILKREPVLFAKTSFLCVN